MDAAQFQAFMQMQQQILSAIAVRTPDQSTDGESHNQSRASVPNFDIFDPAKETFRSYKQRFEIYTDRKKVAADKPFCAKLLLNSIGVTQFNIVSSLAAPENIADIEYDRLVKIIEEYLSPKQNQLVAQHQFLSKQQSDGQTIGEFVALLKRELIDCNFKCESCKKSIADVMLRVQLIRGVKDNDIRAALLQSENDKFDAIFQKATALEAAKMNSKQICKTSTSDSTKSNSSAPAEVNQLKSAKFGGRKSKKKHKNQNDNQNSNQNKTSKSKIDYKELGLDGICLRCGRDNHMVAECRVHRSKVNCSSCKKPGHVAKVCISTIYRNRKPAPANANAIDTSPVREFSINKIVDIRQNNSSPPSEEDDRYFTSIIVENQPVMFEVDSGSKLTLLPKNYFDKMNLNVPLNPPDIRLRSYTQNVFTPYGYANVNISYKGKSIRDKVYVVPNEYSPVVGRRWIRQLKINLENVDQEKPLVLSEPNNVNSISATDDDVNEIKQQFADIFQKTIGCMPDVLVSHELREGAKPVYHRERPIPYALIDRVDRELDALEKSGIITKVDSCDWGSPLVVVLKPDGNVRLCIDYKVGVNERLVDAHCPSMKREDIFNQLKNAKYFCKIDLYNAYFHMKTDEEASRIQAVATHRGVYLVNRLAQGIKTAPAKFNNEMERIRRKLRNNTVSAYLSIYPSVFVKSSLIPSHSEF